MAQIRHRLHGSGFNYRPLAILGGRIHITLRAPPLSDFANQIAQRSLGERGTITADQCLVKNNKTIELELLARGSETFGTFVEFGE